MRTYIPCKKHWKEMFEKYDFFNVVDKFPISKIRRKKLINGINKDDVCYMLLNFDKNAWMPITLNKNNFLIDGQHRLELARQMELEYIDVIVQTENLII